MIIDHRTYTLKPGALNDYVKLYEAEGFAHQRRHLGDPVGWYTSMDIGELNQIVHLWAYADLADRAARRAGLLADPAWLAFTQKAAPMILHMRNKILSPAAFLADARP
ncbi:MAG: NIPSNAP family protein [Burkholderiales bacterium]|nr:NIPSNAP family protein [Burkholderiales bacterium]